MNSKLVTIGAGMFGLGALVSWAITADHMERKMLSRQKLLGELLRRQSKELNDLHRDKVNRSIDVESDIPWPSPSDEAVQAAHENSQKQISDVAAEFGESYQAGATIGPVTSVESVADGIEITGELTRGVADLETDIPPGENASKDEEVDETSLQKARANLQSLIDTYTANPDDVDMFVSKAGKTVEHAMHVPPFVVSRELYSSDPDEGDDYAKITLTYYVRDRILLDDEQEVIDEVEDYVGWRNLNRFGDESGDGDVVFVRNRRLLTDFEVVKEDEEDPPIHIRYGMSRDVFATNRAAGVIKFRDEDSD